MILYLESPKHKLEILAIDGKILLGRGDDNHYILNDSSVSRSHLEIFFRGNKGWTIRDLDSSVGTFVNGMRIQEPTELKIGDHLKIGAIMFTVHFKGGEDVPQVSVEVRTKVLPDDNAKNLVDIAMNKSKGETSMIGANPEDIERRKQKRRAEAQAKPEWVIPLVLILGLILAIFLVSKMITPHHDVPKESDKPAQQQTETAKP